MSFSLTIPQVFYDLIARVLPGFLLLFTLRTCLARTKIDLDPIIAIRSATSIGGVLDALGFLVLCYFAGWLLRGIRWPNLQPSESSDFRTKYQQIRLRHPEAGFRVIKLGAEARLLEASRMALWLVACGVVLAWIGRTTNVVAGESVSHSVWVLCVVLPAAIGFVFLSLERPAWENYHGNVKKLHSLIFDEGFSGEKSSVERQAAEQGNAAAGPTGRR